MQIVKIGNLSIGEGIPKICVPLVEKTAQNIIREIQEIKKLRPDMVEWRADYFEEIENMERVKEQLAVIKDVLDEIPLLFTFRSKKEGGIREISLEDYVNLNQMVAKEGTADAVDIEAFFDVKRSSEIICELKENPITVIASHHNFHETPSCEAMQEYLLEMNCMGADILKIAVMPNKAEDVLTLLRVTEQMKQLTDKPIVSVSMKGLGILSRISGSFFGSAITFGAGKTESAPGQIPVEKLREILLDLEKYK